MLAICYFIWCKTSNWLIPFTYDKIKSIKDLRITNFLNERSCDDTFSACKNSEWSFGHDQCLARERARGGKSREGHCSVTEKNAWNLAKSCARLVIFALKQEMINETLRLTFISCLIRIHITHLRVLPSLQYFYTHNIFVSLSLSRSLSFVSFFLLFFVFFFLSFFFS